MKLLAIYTKLLTVYGEQGWWPIVKRVDKHLVSVYDKSFKFRKKSLSEKFEICVGAILTQNTAWKNVERAIISLKRNNLLSPEKILSTSVRELIKPAGYFNIKEKKLKVFSEFFLNHRKGFFDETIGREELLSLFGIGKETADSILLYALNKPVFVIDAYTKRIFSRVGFFSEDITYDDAQKFFYDNLPKDYKLFNEFHALIVEHAKRYCKKIPDCNECMFRRTCLFSRKHI